MKRFLIYLAIMMSISSCVTNKKYQLMQKNDVHKSQPKDTVLRSYTTQPFDYKLQPFDVVSIRFESLTPTEFDFLSRNSAMQNAAVNPQFLAFFGEVINSAGEVNYPVIGRVVIGGLNIFEAQDKLQALANQFLDSPKVIVRLVNFRVTLLGEMNREGQVIMTNNRVTLLEAIGMAGGLGEFADRSNIKVIRQHGTEVEVHYVNVLDENFVNSPYYYVNQNDIVVVPPLRQRPFRRYFGPNLALVSSSLAFLFLAFNFINK